MNQYDAQNAAVKVDGYFVQPSEPASVDAAFEEARAKCLADLHEGVSLVERMQLSQFLTLRKAGFRADTSLSPERQSSHAAYRIDGYYVPPRHVSVVSAAFEEARAKCLIHLRTAVAHVEQMQAAQFLKALGEQFGVGYKTTSPGGEDRGIRSREGVSG